MEKGTALRIDIETELEAIKKGECGGCRLEFTHLKKDICDNKFMNYCLECKNMYSSRIFDKCPVCQ